MIPCDFFGCGNFFDSQSGDGSGNGIYDDKGFDITCSFRNGNGNGYSNKYTLADGGDGDGSGSGGFSYILQAGGGSGVGEMPYIIGMDDPTDLKSVVMWSMLFGEWR